jgi:hypothetical protein
MTVFAPREFDLSNKYEQALVDNIGGYGGMIIADCSFEKSSRGDRYFLLITPGEDGPLLVGANVAFPGDRAYVDLKEIENADEATRKHYNSDRHSFTSHQKSDLAVIEALGGPAAQPSRIWHGGLSSRDGLEVFDVVRVNQREHTEEARRLIVTHTLMPPEGDIETTVLMDVGFDQLRSWVQDEFQAAFSGPRL